MKMSRRDLTDFILFVLTAGHSYFSCVFISLNLCPLLAKAYSNVACIVYYECVYIFYGIHSFNAMVSLFHLHCIAYN